jgi:CheY-like chemotaxis protein
MKILIVDDNAAIQEILCEILEGDGHTTEVASTVDEAIRAVETYRPDVVLLDSLVNGESGFRVLDSIHDPDSGIHVLMVVTGKEQIPKDNPVLVGFIQKPFRAADVLSKVNAVRSLEDDEPESVKDGKPKKARFSMFKKRTASEQDDDHYSDSVFKFGKSYIMFEKEANEIYKVASFFRSKGCDVLVITTDKAKAVREEVNDRDITVIGLSPKPRGDNLNVAKMGTLMGVINDFIDRSARPAVVFDDLDVLVEHNGLNSVLTMIHQIINNSKKTSTLLVSTNDEPLTDKDKELLLSNMDLYRF